MSEEDNNNFSFLWDKWKHHDTLLYQFSANFWTLQAIAIAAITMMFNVSIIATYVFMFFFGFIGIIFFRSSLILARRCRNTFNKEIVKILKKNKMLDKPKQFKIDTWSPEDDSHPVNLWHTPHPFGGGAKVRGSAIAQKLVVLISSIELLVGITGIIFYFTTK